MKPEEGLSWALDQMAKPKPSMNLWERAKEAMQDFVDKCDRGEALSVRTYAKFKAVLAEMERVECVEGAGGKGLLGYGFLPGPVEATERPALLLLLETDR